MTVTEHIENLQATLSRRETPETVLRLIKDALPPAQSKPLFPRYKHVLAGSVKRLFGWSSMSTVFVAPESMERQVDKARELISSFFPYQLQPVLPQTVDFESEKDTDAFVDRFDACIGKTRGRSDFRTDRLDRASRKALGLSRRRYSKLFRLAGRLERKAARRQEGNARRALLLVGKSALAPRLSVEDFRGDVLSAAFVAYYSARMKLRSEFTIDGQQRPFDEISATLLTMCEQVPTTSWWAIAHVFPREDVLQRLSETERGRLLGTWFDILQQLADRLDDVRARTDIDTETMIVKRGNDSSTWNLLAGAWNRARDHWIALISALQMEGLFDSMLPGKVLKLIAADVAAWHRATGGGIHPDTLVWNSLPAPWLVLRGEASCTRDDVDNICRQHGVDPEKTGWTAPRSLTQVAAFRPTPELVHGVAVSNPYLAGYLKRIGAYSGKPVRSHSIDSLD